MSIIKHRQDNYKELLCDGDEDDHDQCSVQSQVFDWKVSRQGESIVICHYFTSDGDNINVLRMYFIISRGFQAICVLWRIETRPTNYKQTIGKKNKSNKVKVYAFACGVFLNVRKDLHFEKMESNHMKIYGKFIFYVLGRITGYGDTMNLKPS